MPRWPDGEAGGEQPDHKTHRPHTRDTVTAHAVTPPSASPTAARRRRRHATALSRHATRQPTPRNHARTNVTQPPPHVTAARSSTHSIHRTTLCGGHGAVERARLQRRVWAHLAPACRKAPARFRFYPPRPSRDCPMCNLLKASRGFQFLPAMESAARDECLAEAHKPRTHQEHGSSRLLNAGRRGK